jgi:hypothetical protein
MQLVSAVRLGNTLGLVTFRMMYREGGRTLTPIGPHAHYASPLNKYLARFMQGSGWPLLGGRINKS